MNEQIEASRVSYESTLSSQQKELLRAVEFGSLSEIQRLFHGLSNLQKQEKWFDYVLVTTAVRTSHISVIEFLLQNDCRVTTDTKTQFLCVPLYYAIKQDNVKVTGDLITKGASLHGTDVNEETPVDLAMQKRRFETLNVILSKSIQSSKVFDPNCKNNIALFHMACYNCHPADAIKYFLEAGFSVNSRSNFAKKEWDGFTPLHFALSTENLFYSEQAVELLLEHDVDFSAKDHRGMTPVNIAFRDQDSGRSSFPAYPKILKKWISRLTVEEFSNPQDQSGLNHFHIICCGSEDCNETSSYVKAAQFFLHHGVDINSMVSLSSQDYPGYTALQFAVEHFQFDLIKLLLENGADIRKTDGYGLTPLHVACDYIFTPKESTVLDVPKVKDKDRLRVVELLLKHGAEVDVKDLEGATPLHYAFYSKGKDKPVARLLLPLCSQLSSNFIDKNGLSYLHIASCLDLSAVQTLIKAGAQIHSCVNPDVDILTLYEPGYSALHFAVSYNKLSIVEYLLRNGADVNIKINDNRSKLAPIHLACRYETLQLQASMLHDDPTSALQSHVSDRSRIIQLLIQYGASVNEKTTRGSTPLFFACSIPVSFEKLFPDTLPTNDIIKQICDRQLSVIKLLLQNGADVHARNDKGETILFEITGEGELGMQKILAEMMLKEGVDPNVTSNEGLSPLYYIVLSYYLRRSDDLSLLHLFCQYGIDINAQYSSYGTPLHMVAGDCDLEESKLHGIIGYLLDHPEIDLNARDKFGDTPLHVAAKERGNEYSDEFPWSHISFPILNNYLCIAELLSAGADISIKNSKGHSPFDLLYNWLTKHFSLFSERQYPDRCYTEIFISLLTHLKKLIRMNIPISDTVREGYHRLSQLRPQISLKLDEMVELEMSKLKSRMLDQYTSLYDILFKDSNNLAKHVKNKDLKMIMESRQLGLDFPAFHRMLIHRFNKGLMRNAVLEPARKALDLVSGVNWSSSCADNVFKYLDNKILKNLVAAASLDKSLKRSIRDLFKDEKFQSKMPRTLSNPYWTAAVEMMANSE